MAELVDAGEISAKTTNNARTCLSVALNDACRRGLIARNPCAAVPPLPLNRRELDYLRLNEIQPYVSACMTHYRPLAQFLIGTGVRVSEALAIRFRHIALDDGVVRVYGQRGRDGSDSRPTKSKRFRSVQILGSLPGLGAPLNSLADRARHQGHGPRRTRPAPRQPLHGPRLADHRQRRPWSGRRTGSGSTTRTSRSKLTNLGASLPRGFYVSCFPVKIAGASAGWWRAVAIFGIDH
jgi:integrase